ncbi:MAG TPA: zinc-dependent alcohol dehydrogenase family protein [Bryobacteraceae bacterium]|nr:zinc-dependent alcohol dehydrogenase family protein [Bryobacteraceae bacterium]
MKALRFHGLRDLRLDELTTPNPRAGEVRIRPEAAGICGTDAHIFLGEFPAASPVVLGHEIAGTVDAVGAGVAGIREGDLVTIQPNTYCGACRYCRGGREHLCPNLRAYGVHMDGGFAQAMVVRAQTVYPLPAGVSAAVGCLAEPLACCVHGVDRLAIQNGSSVLVLGAGAIGLMLLRLARLSGAGYLAVAEPDEARRQMAISLGADAVFEPIRERLMESTAGQGFDYVIDAVGAAVTFEQAVSTAARGGRILVFGVAPMHASATVRPFDIYARELTILGTFINPYSHERAVQLLPQMGLEKLNIKAFPLDQFKQAFDGQFARSATKMVLLPQA